MHGSKYCEPGASRKATSSSPRAPASPDRVTGQARRSSRRTPEVIHIDIDPAEIGKVREVQIPIVGDLKGVLASIVATLSKRGLADQPNTQAVDRRRSKTLAAAAIPFYHAKLVESEDAGRDRARTRCIEHAFCARSTPRAASS